MNMAFNKISDIIPYCSVLSHCLSEQRNSARIRFYHTEKKSYGRCFSGAVQSQKSINLPGVYMYCYRVDRDRVAKCFGKIICFNNVHSELPDRLNISLKIVHGMECFYTADSFMGTEYSRTIGLHDAV